MVLGIWKPRILLPSACSGEGRKEERELILAHEQAHRLRYDHVTKIFVFGVLVIHWFNPLAWAAFLLYCRDVEMACDEKVMEWLGEESRKPYSLALLRFEEERSVLLIPLAFGESSARERIRHILNYRKPGSWMTALDVYKRQKYPCAVKIFLMGYVVFAGCFVFPVLSPVSPLDFSKIYLLVVSYGVIGLGFAGVYGAKKEKWVYLLSVLSLIHILSDLLRSQKDMEKI